MLRKLLAMLTIFIVAFFVATPAQAGQPELDHKVWVCKYTTTPGGDEVLKNGNDGLVWVSQNAIQIEGKDKGDVAVGDAFADAHEKSIVIQVGGERPDISECPGYEPPPVDVCSNIDGNQADVPAGFYDHNGKCYHKDVDVCVDNAMKTLTWAQYSALEVKPPLYDDSCHPPADMCSNLAGNQSEVPAGWDSKDGKCFHWEVVCWLMDHYNGGAQTPPAGAASTFPQTRVDCATPIPCGMWVQTDHYYIDSFAKEEVWEGLGNTLEHVGGHPEDMAIYKSHEFTYGGACPPPPPMCKDSQMTVADAMEKGYFYDEETGNCYKKVYVCKYITTPGGTEILQTGNNPISVSVNALPGGFAGTFPWEFADAQGRSLAFAWALPGTPQDEEPGLENCPPPPPVDVCIDYEMVSIPAAQYAGHEEDYQLYDRETCHPPVDVCTNLDGLQMQVPEGWTAKWGKCFHWEVVCWLMDNYDGGDKMPPAGQESTFPQTRVDCDSVIPCGMWVQKDVYFIDSLWKEEVWLNLGDTLTYDDGPEDSAIYKSHVFIYGKDCPPPPVKVCEFNAETGAHAVEYAADAAPEGAITWVDGSECTPNIEASLIEPVCTDGAPYLHIDVNLFDPADVSTDDGTIDLLFKKGSFEEWVYDIPLDSLDLSADILWPGASVDSFGVANGWPGWSFVDGAWTNVGNDNDGWTRSGATVTVFFNPEKTFTITYPEATADCVPPPVQVCIDYEMSTVSAADYAADPEKYVLYERETCHPPVDLCPNIEGPQSEIPQGMLLYGEGQSTKCAVEPSLNGTLFSAQCVDDVPWIVYDVNLVDPGDVSTDDGTATFTFTAPGHPGLTFVKTVAIGSGQFLWPGASATDDGDGTWTATGWPGWAFVDDEWVSIGDDNYGWTRDGVTVSIEVNPEMSVTLSYPPPTALCVAGPTEVSDQLDAPPATPVEAEAQFAG